MPNIESLLLLGQAKGIDPTRPLSVGGYIRPEDRITWGDVQAAIGTLEPRHRAALVIKADKTLVEDHERAALLLTLVTAIFRVSAGRSPMHAKADVDEPPIETVPFGITRATRLANTVLEEYCDDRICRECYGKGTVQVYIPERGVVKQNCTHCIGRGYVYWSEAKRARDSGIKRSTAEWKAKYEHPYLTTLQVCRGQHIVAWSLFNNALFGTERSKEGRAA